MWRWLALGGVLVAVESALPLGLGRDLLYLGFSVGAVVMTVVGIRRHRPVPRAPWVLFAVGIGLWAGGDALWALFDHVLDIDPFPSVADVLYIAAYPVLAAGVRALARARNPRGDATAMLDAILVATVAVAVLWILVIGPTFESPETDFLSAAVASAYPLGDVVLLMYLAYLAGDTRFRSPALRMFALGIVVTLAADLLFALVDYLPWVGEGGNSLDFLWLTGYLLLGGAALHPSMAAAGERQPGLALTAFAGLGKLAFLGACLLALPGTALVQRLLGEDPDSVELAVAGVVVILLVFVRMMVMTRQLVRQSDRLAALAASDALTGLPNLRLFTDEVAVRLADPEQPRVPIMLVNLDRFAEIKETLGFRVTDELLRAAGQRLAGVLGDRGMIARVGGDAFGVVVFDHTMRSDDLATCASQLRSELSEPFTLSDVSVSIDGLVGVAVGPDDGGTPTELLQRADVALSAARSRPDRVARYSGRLPADGTLTPHLMSELPAALASDQIVLHYQPQVAVDTGQVIGVEALVRWQHPVHGLLPPAAFIPAAERTGLIRPITRAVLDRALAYAADLHADGRRLAVSVNLSVRDLLDAQFPQEVEQALARHGVDRSLLELEVTESMAMVDPNRSLRVLHDLAELGVRLSVDDYGTGYSSLAYLQRLPVQRLKIDRSFVMGMVHDSASVAIVRSTVELARNLGLTVVAEGVEDDATLLALRDMGCAVAQGFGLGRPVPADRLLDVVDAIERRLAGVLADTLVLPQQVG
ncbi:putative bifunctional diguanylate cyclase/phosphodiesterase [Actinotalea fermentans]|uniref:GGDEF-domain containing protein n=1 Tax=Actinotalea fermentans TaxID=43671 RepID=A0A511Z1G3_9CELL|nr:bifunctional diguanylate cyclase/phosphodiesterase [Actinotalea fermentans]KGM17060.1 hypothetical protein N867_10535 [Actinotalea fermentans ATCC 43279 = JCM 9966 = DSM 3133]GEN81282.1 hypothetical protein AFE02nite_30160 [Actinotalea fermentans]